MRLAWPRRDGPQVRTRRRGLDLRLPPPINGDIADAAKNGFGTAVFGFGYLAAGFG
jgi:hypothetical protein